MSDLRKLMERMDRINEDREPYMVMIGGGVSDLYSTPEASTPEQAATLFFKAQQKSPLDVAITGDEDAMQALVVWAQQNKEQIAHIMHKTGADKVFYVDEWIKLLDGISYDSLSGQVYPFDRG